MYAWAGNQTEPGGFYRIRATGKPAYLPVGLQARRDGISLTITDALDRKAAEDPDRWAVRVWSLKRTENYGSKHHDEKPLRVTSARLSDDGKTVSLAIPAIGPTMSMQIAYEVRSAGGTVVEGKIHNTIHNLGPPLEGTR